MTPADCACLVGERLLELTAQAETYPDLREAMNYSLQAGGKRIRPVLHMLSAGMFGAGAEDSLDTACAIEMIHTYSLIHDDLPAMDDDELRRGRPTSHVVFGEALAILAGDALLSYALEILTRSALAPGHDPVRYLVAMDLITAGAGVSGMLAGQTADVQLEGQLLSREQLSYIHERKTGALIAAAAASGAAIAGASQEEIAKLQAFGASIGLAFQIVDDVLDVEGTPEVLGKHPGKDRRSDKYTFVSAYGVDASRRMAEEYTDRAVASIAPFGEAAKPLIALAFDMARRDR